MKIAIDLTSLFGRKMTGVEMFAIDLYKALLKTDYEIIPIFHARNIIDNNPKACIIPQRPRLWLENISLDYSIRKIKADVIFFPVFPPPITLFFRCNSIIIKIIHDTIFFTERETLNTAAKYYYTPKMKFTVKKADMILTVSHTIQNKLEKILKRNILYCGENISEDYKNVETKSNITCLYKWGLKPNEYILSVSTVEPRKNMKYLLQVTEKYLRKKNMKLVLVGKIRQTKDIELLRTIERMKDVLIFTGFIEENDVISLYKYSYAFALLSSHEGFGRTPFEAVASGCKKIILSDIDIFRETFNHNATFLPLNDISQCEEIISKENFIEISPLFKVPYDVLEINIKKILLQITK